MEERINEIKTLLRELQNSFADSRKIPSKDYIYASFDTLNAKLNKLLLNVESIIKLMNTK